MKVVLKIRAIGLFSSVFLLILLNLKPIAASSAVVEPPAITIQKVTVGTGNQFTLQYKTNLLSPNWQTLGAFSGSTNLSFSDLPAVFIRGVCSKPVVSVTLTWPASTDASVAGYKLYYGPASGGISQVIDVGQTTSATVSNLIAGTEYYFATTTYNSNGVQSPYLTETNAAFQAKFSLDCTELTATATLAWQPSSDPAVVGYKVYYGLASHDYTDTVNVGPATTATISNLVKGTTYYFAVTAYNSANVESSFSNEASGAFQPRFSLTIGNP